jgi:hypothetical protein
MRKIYLIIILTAVTSAFIPGPDLLAQCTPADSTECPDPENNGQVCPDSLAPAYLGEFYSVVATILPPTTYGDTFVVTLHHITLVEVGNLPGGLTWQSNAPGNEFMAGEYYCILMEGTPDSVGTYPLHIVVDVWITILPGFPPVYAGQIVDSTSLVMEVLEPSSVPEGSGQSLYIASIRPNPMSQEAVIGFYSKERAQATMELYTLSGSLVHRSKSEVREGPNEYLLKRQGGWPQGHYFYILRTPQHTATGTIIMLSQ